MQQTKLCSQHTMAGHILVEQFWLTSYLLCLPPWSLQSSGFPVRKNDWGVLLILDGGVSGHY